MFRIAITGGGIGGLFAALCIHHHCKSQRIKIDVYEQAQEYGEIGAGVGIGPNAATLVERLGLKEEALAIAGDREGIWLSFRRYDTGAEVLTIMNPTNRNTTQLPMHRAEFLELLVKAIQRRGAATLHTNKRCEGIEHDAETRLTEIKDQDDTMLVKFADGTTASANLVIGADGIHSVVRSHYIHDTAQYGEMVVYRGLCDMEKIQGQWDLPTYAALFMAPGKHFLTFPISNNKILNVVGFVSTPLEKLGDVRESWTLAGDKSEVQEEFKDFAPVVQSVIRNMNAHPLKWVLFDRKSTPQWIFSGGKVALLGDAAHAMCPHQGMFLEAYDLGCRKRSRLTSREWILGAGAGQALEDGWIIGRSLREYFQALESPRPRSLQSCLHLYQSIRVARAEKVQVTSRQAGDLYEMKIDEVAGLSYDEGLPIVKDKLKDRMQWIWNEDLDQVFDQARTHWQRPSALQ
ncbi:uncharacterized protein N7482_007605 [Penicillium canariense]|uniref:FAD-binding domain-containing protein n=1 Tax=Penicillium canariense TaxID=189055 RepID=A0A9W9HZE3_9EURO|nr:uncharacterized protein N7482_007605 [Penicillium canariense]KAJ5160601.1 hypothetical protein N7482_007605 [Penicillium canariense]